MLTNILSTVSSLLPVGFFFLFFFFTSKSFGSSFFKYVLFVLPSNSAEAYYDMARLKISPHLQPAAGSP